MPRKLVSSLDIRQEAYKETYLQFGKSGSDGRWPADKVRCVVNFRNSIPTGRGSLACIKDHLNITRDQLKALQKYLDDPGLIDSDAVDGYVQIFSCRKAVINEDVKNVTSKYYMLLILIE